MLEVRRSLTVAAVVLAIIGLVPAPARAAQPQLVVLRITGEGFGKAILDSATTAAETAALRVLAGRFKIVTRDMLSAIVGEAKLLKCEAEARCELDLGTGLGTGYMLAGSIRKVGSGFELAMKLYDVRKLDLLAQETASARHVDELVKRVGPLVEQVMRTGLGFGVQAAAQPPSSGAAEKAQAASLPAAAAPGACPPGMEGMGGHCCWPGQDWGMASGRCVGSAECPSGFKASGDGCAAGCPDGKALVAGHYCCWPGQDWGVRAGKCIGTPSCAAGWLLTANGECSRVPEGMVWLGGGTYTTGATQTAVTVQPFLLDVTAVSVRAYEGCVNAGKCSAEKLDGSADAPEDLRVQAGQRLGVPADPYCNWSKTDRANHPMNCVDYAQATTYCEWAKKRLPTEEEREWAARGAEKGTKHPWGNGEPADQLCWNGGGVQRHAKRLGTCAVASFPAGDSPEGLKDLAGNVWEWTSGGWWLSRVVRGGSWSNDDPSTFAASNGDKVGAANHSNVIGFRCARTP
jgi:formylglycine-generating enzyme required for sulfatase activity